MSKTTAERVADLLIDHFDPARTIGPESRLIEDLQADSLDLVEIAMELEDEFDIDLPDNEMDTARTVAELIALVERKLPGSAS